VGAASQHGACRPPAERWILPALDTWNYLAVAEAFRAQDLPMPTVGLVTSAVHTASHLLAEGRFVTAISKLIAESLSLHVLPIELGLGSWPAVIVTIKNRMLSPATSRFIECAREVVNSIGTRR
jgi:DNA-binding transcriptional LysR family regulator